MCNCKKKQQVVEPQVVITPEPIPTPTPENEITDKDLMS